MVVAVLLCGSASAEAVRYHVDEARTHAHYVIVEFGVFPQRGSFARTSGRVVLDQDAEQGEIDVLVDAASFQSGWDLRDAFARSEPMLDAAHHPHIRFTSHHLVYRDRQPVRIEGHVNLRGVDRPMTLAVDRFDCGASGPAACEVAMHTRLKRSDFGFARYAPFLGDDVELWFDVVMVADEK
ncbi:MAG TPA: YceI family protein [Casimicrobiaceae bacterium]|nr:YceI family protein [Casimicrobiaceae bacterium]